MESITQLIDISNYRPQSGHLLELFDMLNGGDSRETAKGQFLKKGNNTAYFDVLFNRLEGRLMEGVLLNSFKDYSAFRQMLIKLFKDYAIIRTLIVSDNTLAGIPKGEKVMRQLEHYGMIELALSLSLEIERYFASVQLDKKYLKYKEINDHLKKEWEKEFEARRVFSALAWHIQRKKQICHFEEKLNKLDELSPSPYFIFNLYRFSTWALYYRHTAQVDSLLSTCNQALVFFKHFSSPIPYTTEWNFARQTVPILIEQKKFDKAEAMVIKCIQLCDLGSYNWQLSLIYMATLGFHSGKPKMALSAYQKAMDACKKFSSDAMRERWELIGAYLHLYEMLGHLKMKTKFKIAKFLNSMTIQCSDKGKMDAAVIIVEMMHHWIKGDKEAFGQKAQSIPDYIKNHLRGKGQERLRYFCYLLKGLYESNYHPARYARIVKPWMKKLQNTSVKIGADIFHPEIIPFEAAWELLMSR
jgi:hypothetical protein